ncbi:MAG TPA: cation:proton antiporter [Armatimonadota bacterium]|nr:cation:proton antiporter [Armatimonadota bacterium]
MTGADILRELTIALGAGLAGGLVARSLRLPTIVGYLVAGVAAGPAGLNVVRDLDTVTSMAELGVALLLFALGVELSLRSLRQGKLAALVAAPTQLALSVGLGYGLGELLGWGFNPALILGFALALSSTMVVVRLLGDRGELHTNHGRLMIAVLLVQDLAAVLMVGVLPFLAGTSAMGLAALGGLLIKGLIFLLGVFVLAHWLVPALLRVVARSYNKEVFVALAAMLCFGGAFGAHYLGFSLALGAFVAGLVLGESDYSHEVLADITPLRDLFGMVFFVSLGLLFDPASVLDHPAWALAILAAVVAGKAAIVVAACLLARFHVRSALVAGLGLANVGEFSFVVATVAFSSGLITREHLSLVQAVAAISLLLSPALFGAGGALYRRLRLVAAADEQLAREELRDLPQGCAEREAFVLLCGYGRVGRHVGETLLEDGEHFAVVDFDQGVVAELRSRGTPAFYGDAASWRVLEAAGAERCCLAVLALPDAITTRLAIRALKRVNPHLAVLARVHPTEEIDPMYREGADEVVQAEFEASLEIIRHTLLHLGREPAAAQARVDAVRRQRYLALRRRDRPDDAG